MTVYKFAGFWRRLVAFMIDSTMVTIIFVVLCVIAGLAFFFGAMSANNSALLNDLVKPKGFSSVVSLILGFYIVINIAYFTYFHGTTG
ncbi:MAG: RDD family protein, partial [Deltaproteobacteria bacterium]